MIWRLLVFLTFPFLLPRSFNVIGTINVLDRPAEVQSLAIIPGVFDHDGECVAATLPGGQGLTNCPTHGGLALAVTGSFFFDMTSTLVLTRIWIGPTECQNITLLTPISVDAEGIATVSCTLPPGKGQELKLSADVIRNQGLVLRSLLSYADPAVEAVLGCAGQSGLLGARECLRSGGLVLTLLGRNFGASDAVVLVGDRTCDNVQHFSAESTWPLAATGIATPPAYQLPHRGLTCTLKNGMIHSTHLHPHLFIHVIFCVSQARPKSCPFTLCKTGAASESTRLQLYRTFNAQRVCFLLPQVTLLLCIPTPCLASPAQQGRSSPVWGSSNALLAQQAKLVRPGMQVSVQAACQDRGPAYHRVPRLWLRAAARSFSALVQQRASAVSLVALPPPKVPQAAPSVPWARSLALETSLVKSAAWGL